MYCQDTVECIQRGFAFFSLHDLFMRETGSRCFQLDSAEVQLVWGFFIPLFSLCFIVANLKCFEMFALTAFKACD